MSPDEQSVLDTIAAAVRRTRIIALAEALAWGGAAAAIWLMASPPVLVFVLTWRLRASGRKAVVTAIERTHRDARNLFVTADELSRGVLSAKPVVRDRVFAHASLESQRLNLKTFARILPFTRAASVAGAAWILVLTASMWRQPLDRLTGRGGSGSASSAAVGAAGLRVSVSLTPPGYTRLAPSSTVDPQQIAAVEGTVASLAIDGSAARVTVEHEGATRPLTRDGSGRFVDRIELRKTGYYAVETDLGARRVIPIVVSPDGLPAMQLTAPGRDLVYPRADRRVEFDVRATDDFGLRALGLEYTKVSGSGEQFEFQEGQIPLTLSKASDREWRGTHRDVACRAHTRGRRHPRVSRRGHRCPARRRHGQVRCVLHRNLEARRGGRRRVHGPRGRDAVRPQPADADHQDRTTGANPFVDGGGRFHRGRAGPRGGAAHDPRGVRVHARRRSRRRGRRGPAVERASGRSSAEPGAARCARRDHRHEPGGEAAHRVETRARR